MTTRSEKLQNFVYQLDDRFTLAHKTVLLLIFSLGISLRLYAWYFGEGYLYYAINDEMQAYRYALGFIAGEQDTYYLGQPAFASGQLPGPVWTVFWVMLLKLGQGSVHYALLWMTLFNSLAIFVFYRLARNFVAGSLALFATLFFAIAPWTVYYSVAMWNPLPLAVIGGLLFLALWNTLANSNSRQIFWVCLLSAIIPQFHMIGIFYLPVILLLLIINDKTINKKWLVLGIVAGVLVYLPYLIGEINHDFANTRAMLTGSDKASFGVLKIITAPLTMITSIPAGWAGREFSATIDYANQWFGSIYILLSFCIISLVYAATIYFSFLKKYFLLVKQNFSKPQFLTREHRHFFFLGSLIVLPLLLFMLTRHDYATRYTLPSLPLLFLTIAIFFRPIRPGNFRRVLYITTAILLVFNLYLTLSFFAFQAKQIKGGAVFSPSFRSLESLSNNLYDKTGRKYHINIALSDRIMELPEGNRKIAIALSDYFKIIQRYGIVHSSSENTITIEMMTTDEVSALDGRTILHQANGMIFTINDRQVK